MRPVETGAKLIRAGLMVKFLWGSAPLVLGLFMAALMVLMVIFMGTVAGMGQATQTQNVSSQCVSDSAGSLEGEGSETQRQALAAVPEEYKPLFEQAASDIGIAYETVATQIYQESRFDPRAGSHAGAKGLAQFIDSTFFHYVSGGDPYNPQDAMRAYTAYMNELKEMFTEKADGDQQQLLVLMLAGYNAGPGAVQQFDGVPPYPETTHYVEVILGNQQVTFSAGCQQVDGNKAWDGDLGTGEWTNPCPGCVFTSGYGWRNVFPPGDWRNEHVGVDLASPGAGRGDGGPIIAPTDMTVEGFLPQDGCVTTRQKEAPHFAFNFCHMHSWGVSVGDELKRGDIIGIEGGRGNGVNGYYGTHLHLEIYKPDSPVPAIPYNGFNLDPEPILKAKGAWVSG